MKNNRLLQLITLILVIIFFFKVEFFQNLSFIYKNNYDQRFFKVYDFCNNESVGYLKYLKKKFKFKKRPKIVNYTHTPNLSWVIIDPNAINDYSDYKVLLNYPGETIDLKFSTPSKNTYIIHRLNFYKDKTNTIDKLQLNFNEKFQFSENLKVDLYTNSIIGSKKIKTFDNYSIKNDNTIEFMLNIDLISNTYSNESLIFKVKNIEPNIINKTLFTSNNKYKISEYDVMDNYKNCYFVK
jgi:hypothetical protein